MDKYQPLRDTIGLMAGTSVRRPAPRGERFEIPEKTRASRRTRLTLPALVASVLLRIPFHV